MKSIREKGEIDILNKRRIQEEKSKKTTNFQKSKGSDDMSREDNGSEPSNKVLIAVNKLTLPPIST